MRRHEWQSIAGALACIFLLTGCASAVAVRLPRASSGMPCMAPAEDRDVLVGVALSGGGTRAALFGSAGLEALGRVRLPDGHSLLEGVNYLSSVSGGSVAAAYYASKKPPRETSVLGPDGALTEEYRMFFDRYRQDLSQDFEDALIWRQIGTFRWINPALAARSLAEIFNERLYEKMTIGDLRAREARGDAPRLIINTTLYNNGRRLALGTIPTESFQYSFFQDLQAALASRGRPTEIPAPLKARWEVLMPLTATDLHLDLCNGGLAGAVAASASFPPLVGPITFQVGNEEIYWHAGDGGLYENQGIESLLFVFLKKIQERKARRALIIAFDSSYPFAVGYRQLTRRAEPFSLFSYDFSRIPSIMEERATAYQGLFFRSLQMDGVFPDARTIGAFLLKHTDAKWEADLSDLPAACRGEKLASPEDVVERIAEIPTRFWLGSECDRQLLATAAAKVVEQNRAAILRFIQDQPR
jgi:Patatin-like phospholipase